MGPVIEPTLFCEGSRQLCRHPKMPPGCERKCIVVELDKALAASGVIGVVAA